jgi:predicted aminopeptidase
MKWLWRFTLLLALLLCVGALYYAPLLPYGWRQLKGQLHVLWHTVPLEEVWKNDTLSPAVRYRLHLIGEIKAFAETTLSLKPTDNYRTFYDTRGEPVLWVVTAAPPYALDYYYWYFPFLGQVSYKGHFERIYAEQDSARLSAEGYEVSIGEVAAWSTLGILSDPILSSMTERSEGELAELIIHELTHATVYLPDSVEFNENLASFVGQEGAKLFLQQRYGKHSFFYRDYERRLKDRLLYINFLLHEAARLDSLYRSEHFRALPNAEKQRLKNHFYAELEKKLLGLPFSAPTRLQLRRLPPRLNNVELCDVLRYYSRQDTLRWIFQQKFHSRLPAMIQSFKK